jgi:polar amino acid transport system permease protein
MNYTFHFAEVWGAWEELASGAALTLRLSVLAMLFSLIVAIFGALGRKSGPRWLRTAIASYVEIIRNTPFLVQIFLIFFGLPSLSVRLDANSAALLAMILNGSAYTIEIIRAGLDSVALGQSEAAAALGLHRWAIFRKVVLPQALQAVYAPLGSQFILLMLNSSIVSTISADELTAAAQDIQGRTFRAFEVYIVATAIYFALSMLFTGLFSVTERLCFARPGSR